MVRQNGIKAALAEDMRSAVDAWHSMPADQVAYRFHIDTRLGLSQPQAQEQLERAGPNHMHAEKQEPFWAVLLEELREPMQLLLLFTGVLYSIWGRLEDAITIFCVILTLALIEVYNEQRAKKAIAALRQLAEPTTLVRREGQEAEIPAQAIVPGDVVLLQAGRRVPADARLVEAFGLSIDESALTGESVPADKEAGIVLPESTPLAERRNMVFAGTSVVRGRAVVIVIATGMATELGRVAGMARQVKSPRTPLQLAMKELTRSLVWIALGFSLVIPILGLLSGQPLQQMLLTGLSLAFATIPEEMPIIITMVLALGGYRLSKRRAVVKRLQAVETLGAITVIATDKTGTLTENQMQVSQFYPEQQAHHLLELGVMCNDSVETVLRDYKPNPAAQQPRFMGDPLEVALLQAARDTGIGIEALRRDGKLCEEFTFDNSRKRMSVVYARDDGMWVIVKGAPEAILACVADGHTSRREALDAAAHMARQGLRVIAFAEKMIRSRRLSPVPVECSSTLRATAAETNLSHTPLSQEEAEAGLTFAGLIGFADPPRPEVKAAIAVCRAAGIRTIMVTGDHPLTASAVANQVGLDGNATVLAGSDLDQLSDEALQDTVAGVSIYARTTPEHKLRIVRALHARGERVAVTGDGINDAPALAAADIGIAMGETGTDVAREAGDMVLADDNFATIAHAVEEGRVLFANLRKGVRYYLACKVALISATLLPVLLLVPVPFAPVQIILMELFMDLAASATFVAEPGEGDLMRRPPCDPRASFMDRAMVSTIFMSAVGLFAAVAVAYLATWFTSHDLAGAQTVAFVSWLLGHMLLAMNMRSERQPLLKIGLFSNRLMAIWAAATVVFVVVATSFPVAQAVLKTVPLTAGQWVLVVGSAVTGTFWLELRKWLLSSER